MYIRKQKTKNYFDLVVITFISAIISYFAIVAVYDSLVYDTTYPSVDLCERYSDLISPTCLSINEK